MKEVWKNIKGYEGVYQVSNLGRIKSLHFNRELIMKLNLKRNGYYQIRLKNKGKTKDYIVHRLVAETFIPDPNNYPCINHIDENKQNNKVENLEWCTVLYNNTYGQRINKVKKALQKKIYQYDFNWNLVNVYESNREASEKTKIPAGNISACCIGNYKQAGGYYWRHKEVI